MTELSDFWPFFTAFAMLVAAGFGAPIPEELPTIGAGIWVASNPELGPLRWLILPVCFAGVLISDVMLYSIGRWSGPRLLERAWVKRILPPNRWQRIEGNFARYGVKVLLLIRWVPAIRTPIFISAGIMRLPFGRFILADGIAAVVGHSLLFFLAWKSGEQFRTRILEAEEQVNKFKPLLILLLVGVIAGFLLYHFLSKPVSTADPHEFPIIGEKVAASIDSTVKPLHHEGQEPHQQTNAPSGDGKPASDSTESKIKSPSPES